MKSIYDTRRSNLRKLLHEWGGPTSMARKLGHTNGSYIAQLAGPHPSREISEKVAREIESKLSLPANWLDADHNGDTPRQLDDEVLGACVRAVAAAVRDAKIQPSPDTYADLVALVYEHTKLKGRVEEAFVNKIVRLIKK